MVRGGAFGHSAAVRTDESCPAGGIAALLRGRRTDDGEDLKHETDGAEGLDPVPHRRRDVLALPWGEDDLEGGSGLDDAGKQAVKDGETAPDRLAEPMRAPEAAWHRRLVVLLRRAGGAGGRGTLATIAQRALDGLTRP